MTRHTKGGRILSSELADAGREGVSEGSLPCAREQESHWLAERISDIGAANNLPLIALVTGRIDIEALQAALRAVVDAHQALRMRFFVQRGRLRWSELPVGGPTLPVVRRTTADPAGDIERLCSVPLSLEQTPAAVHLLHGPRGRDFLLFVFHHAIFDGLSKDVFAHDLFLAYARARATPDLPPALQGYGDYASYVQREREAVALLRDQARSHWPGLLCKIQDAPRFLACGHRDPACQTAGEVVRFVIGKDLKFELERLAAGAGVSLLVALLGGVQLLQSAYAGLDRGGVATHVPMTTRPRDAPGRIGMYVNMTAIYSEPRPLWTISAFLDTLSVSVRAALRLRAYPYAQAISEFGGGTDPRDLVPDVMLSYWKRRPLPRLPMAPRVRLDRLAPVFGRWSAARFRFIDEDARLSASLEYCSADLRRKHARRVTSDLLRVLGAMVREDGAIKVCNALAAIDAPHRAGALT
jgi:hypothetical protein